MMTSLPLRWFVLMTLTFHLSFHPGSQLANAKVIMFFPTPSTSHVRYHTNVARAVSQLGHQAWVCIPDYLTKTAHVDTSGISVLSYGQSLGDIEKRLIASTGIHQRFWDNDTISAMELFSISASFDRVVSEIMEGDLFHKVQAIHPDLCVLDGLPFVRPMYVIPYKLGVPHAVLGTLLDVLAYRVPASPAATPLQITVFNDHMDFFQRVRSATSYLFLWIRYYVIEEDFVSKYAPEKPYTTLSDIVARSEVFVVELDPILDYPRPMLPNTKLVGGTAVKQAKPLKGPFKDFLDKSGSGVILVSFGSSMPHVPDYVFDKINHACLASGLNVVWRSTYSSPNPNRILTKDWIPQNDLLGHPNTKLFLSHCGKNGQYEALYHGVPILCMPVFGDQPYNSERVRAKGLGLAADIRFVSRQELTRMVQGLLTNATYNDAMKKASGMFRQLYKNPMQEAAFWLDHVIQYGGEYMRSSSQTMALYQFLMLDVLALVLGVMLVFSLLTGCLLRCCFRCLRHSLTGPGKIKRD